MNSARTARTRRTTDLVALTFLKLDEMYLLVQRIADERAISEASHKRVLMDDLMEGVRPKVAA